MDQGSDTLSSPRTVESNSSGDNVQEEKTSEKYWAWPITTCIKEFRGGGLIVNSVHFNNALAEAERLWVEGNIDYRMDEETTVKKNEKGQVQSDAFLIQKKDEHIRRLQQDLEKLSLENIELRTITENDDGLRKKQFQNGIGPHDIAPMYSDIYNNEWGEAFSYLTRKKKFKEREAIEELLRLAENIYEFCEKMSSDQLVSTINTLCIPCDDQTITKKINIPDTRRLPDDVMNIISKCRLMTSHQSAQIIEQIYFQQDKMSKLPKNEYVKNFISKCIHCFWLMRLQNPSMHLSFKIKRGSPFYPDVVMNYARAGPLIDFVVWPTVLLYERGPVILKGIVQCMPGK